MVVDTSIYFILSVPIFVMYSLSDVTNRNSMLVNFNGLFSVTMFMIIKLCKLKFLALPVIKIWENVSFFKVFFS